MAAPRAPRAGRRRGGRGQTAAGFRCSNAGRARASAARRHGARRCVRCCSTAGHARVHAAPALGLTHPGHHRPRPSSTSSQFLDRIKKAYDRNAALANLLVDPEFADEVNGRQAAWRRVVALCVASGIACPSFSASLGYFDQYRRVRLPANLTQAQRDFFGAHGYERTDKPGSFHTEWAK